MDDVILPRTSSALRKTLALRMGALALLVGLTTGGLFYVLETRRIEQGVLEWSVEGVRHFESGAKGLLAKGDDADKHRELKRLVDGVRIAGIRVFDAEQGIVFENWAETTSATIRGAVQSHRHEWPASDARHWSWSELSGEQLVQVVVPLRSQGKGLIGYLEVTSRLDPRAVQARREQIRNGALSAFGAVLLTALIFYPLLLAFLKQSTRLGQNLLDSNLSLLRSLGNAVAKRDSDTDAHNYRVTLYAVALAEAMALAPERIAELVTGAFLHDVGKIGIPDQILLKPGKLSADEFAIMKTHVLLGIEIVEDNLWLRGATRVIRYHHERFDGGGYPDGLKGRDIPDIARIFAVVDVFDALTSERPYKKPMSVPEAMAIIEGESGSHFDPDMVMVFRDLAQDLHETTRLAESHELRRRLRETTLRYFTARTTG